MKRIRRNVLITAIVLAMLIYVGAFHALIRRVHVTYHRQPGQPILPQHVMYASSQSEAVNVAAHVVFFPIIWIYEIMGDSIYIHDASDFAGT